MEAHGVLPREFKSSFFYLPQAVKFAMGWPPYFSLYLTLFVHGVEESIYFNASVTLEKGGLRSTSLIS